MASLSYHACRSEGCSLHDLIQPGFTFLVGVAMPFSIASRSAFRTIPIQRRRIRHTVVCPDDGHHAVGIDRGRLAETAVGSPSTIASIRGHDFVENWAGTAAGLAGYLSVGQADLAPYCCGIWARPRLRFLGANLSVNWLVPRRSHLCSPSCCGFIVNECLLRFKHNRLRLSCSLTRDVSFRKANLCSAATV